MRGNDSAGVEPRPRLTHSSTAPNRSFRGCGTIGDLLQAGEAESPCAPRDCSGPSDGCHCCPADELIVAAALFNADSLEERASQSIPKGRRTLPVNGATSGRRCGRQPNGHADPRKPTPVIFGSGRSLPAGFGDRSSRPEAGRTCNFARASLQLRAGDGMVWLRCPVPTHPADAAARAVTPNKLEEIPCAPLSVN